MLSWQRAYSMLQRSSCECGAWSAVVAERGGGTVWMWGGLYVMLPCIWTVVLAASYCEGIPHPSDLVVWYYALTTLNFKFERNLSLGGHHLAVTH